MQVVIDTNIIISAFLSENGSCRLFMNILCLAGFGQMQSLLK